MDLYEGDALSAGRHDKRIDEGDSRASAGGTDVAMVSRMVFRWVI